MVDKDCNYLHSIGMEGEYADTCELNDGRLVFDEDCEQCEEGKDETNQEASH